MGGCRVRAIQPEERASPIECSRSVTGAALQRRGESFPGGQEAEIFREQLQTLLTWQLRVRRLIRSDIGASLAEYMLLVILIAILALVAVQFVGDSNSQMWSEVASALD